MSTDDLPTTSPSTMSSTTISSPTSSTSSSSLAQSSTTTGLSTSNSATATTSSGAIATTTTFSLPPLDAAANTQRMLVLIGSIAGAAALLIAIGTVIFIVWSRMRRKWRRKKQEAGQQMLAMDESTIDRKDSTATDLKPFPTRIVKEFPAPASPLDPVSTFTPPTRPPPTRPPRPTPIAQLGPACRSSSHIMPHAGVPFMPHPCYNQNLQVPPSTASRRPFTRNTGPQIIPGRLRPQPNEEPTYSPQNTPPPVIPTRLRPPYNASLPEKAPALTYQPQIPVLSVEFNQPPNNKSRQFSPLQDLRPDQVSPPPQRQAFDQSRPQAQAQSSTYSISSTSLLPSPTRDTTLFSKDFGITDFYFDFAMPAPPPVLQQQDRGSIWTDVMVEDPEPEPEDDNIWRPPPGHPYWKSIINDTPATDHVSRPRMPRENNHVSTSIKNNRFSRKSQKMNPFTHSRNKHRVEIRSRMSWLRDATGRRGRKGQESVLEEGNRGRESDIGLRRASSNALPSEGRYGVLGWEGRFF